MKEVLPAVARAVALTVRFWEVRAADDFESVFGALSKQRPDGLYVPGGGPLMFANEKQVADFALKSRVAVDVHQQRNYRCRWTHVLRGRHRGQLPARRILRGPNPEGSQACRSPGEAPTKFELVINHKTAQQIGLAIPPEVLARASKVDQVRH